MSPANGLRRYARDEDPIPELPTELMIGRPPTVGSDGNVRADEKQD